MSKNVFGGPLMTCTKGSGALKTKLDKPKVWQGCMNYFPDALAEVARVSEFGAIKHGNPLKERGFMHERYTIPELTDAMSRHILGLSESEVNYEDGEVYHRAQIAWGALASLQKILEKTKGKKNV